MALGSEEVGKKNGVAGGKSFMGTWLYGYKDVVKMGECGPSAQLSAVWTAAGWLLVTNTLHHVLASTDDLHRPNDGCFLYTFTLQW